MYSLVRWRTTEFCTELTECNAHRTYYRYVVSLCAGCIMQCGVRCAPSQVRGGLNKTWGSACFGGSKNKVHTQQFVTVLNCSSNTGYSRHPCTDPSQVQREGAPCEQHGEVQSGSCCSRRTVQKLGERYREV